MNILICDDNTEVLIQEEFIVEEAAQKVSKKNTIHTAKTAKDCLKMCEQFPSFYDVLFLDIELPKMSGIELGKIIKKKYPIYQFSKDFVLGDYCFSCY